MTHSRRKDAVLPDVPPLVWTVREVAAALRINYETVLAMVHGGTLAAIKPGKEYLIPQEEVTRLLDEAVKKAADVRAATSQAVA